MMKSENQWNLIFFKADPFDLTPPTDLENVIWAGMSNIKQHFSEIFEVAISSPATQVILNRGTHGGGKTHASLYFSLEKNLPPLSTMGGQVHSIRCHVPNEIGKSDEDFYTTLLDEIGMTYVQKIVQEAVLNLSETQALQSFQRVLGSEEIARAFWLLGTEEASDKHALLRTYFLDGCTRTELRKLGIARNISKAQDRFRILACVLQCLIGLDSTRDPSQHSRVCLWIDEMEDLLYFTPAQFRTLTQGLREMIDRLPNFFTLFLNITLSVPEEYEDIELMLGRAVIDRITDTIYFPELTVDEGIQYVKALINNPQHRDQDILKDLPQTYPFEETALRMLLDDMEIRTPRNINIRCRNVINYAFRDTEFETGKSIINSVYVRKIEQSELNREV